MLYPIFVDTLIMFGNWIILKTMFHTWNPIHSDSDRHPSAIWSRVKFCSPSWLPRWKWSGVNICSPSRLPPSRSPCLVGFESSILSWCHTGWAHCPSQAGKEHRSVSKNNVHWYIASQAYPIFQPIAWIKWSNGRLCLCLMSWPTRIISPLNPVNDD